MEGPINYTLKLKGDDFHVDPLSIVWSLLLN
jgi:hypothetical protein